MRLEINIELDLFRRINSFVGEQNRYSMQYIKIVAHQQKDMKKLLILGAVNSCSCIINSDNEDLRIKDLVSKFDTVQTKNCCEDAFVFYVPHVAKFGTRKDKLVTITRDGDNYSFFHGGQERTWTLRDEEVNFPKFARVFPTGEFDEVRDVPSYDFNKFLTDTFKETSFLFGGSKLKRLDDVSVTPDGYLVGYSISDQKEGYAKHGFFVPSVIPFPEWLPPVSLRRLFDCCGNWVQRVWITRNPSIYVATDSRTHTLLACIRWEEFKRENPITGEEEISSEGRWVKTCL